MSVAGFGDVALGAAGGVASAGGLARVTIATTVTDSRTIPKAYWSPLAGDQYYATLGKARLSAAMKCARSSPSARPRGSST